ncbi:MAG TPA: hypothetical protein VFG53_02865 [Anaeromyxobacter sp.]|nr:hypothetical protein [Anaeromyxobacter sp.]
MTLGFEGEAEKFEPAMLTVRPPRLEPLTGLTVDTDGASGPAW